MAGAEIAAVRFVIIVEQRAENKTRELGVSIMGGGGGGSGFYVGYKNGSN
jgi:hypothetical protein